MTSFSNSHLKVQAKTWSRDSYGLYDYETSSLNFQNITVNKPCLLTRIQNEITCNNPLATLTSEATEEVQDAQRTNSILASVTECPEGIKISASKAEREAERYEHAFWSVIERENTSGHMLQVSDVIRLGRVIFKINQIRVVDEEKKNPQHHKIILDSIKAHMQKDPFNGAEGLKEAPEARMSTANYSCKICLGEEEDPADPLITPCDCTGSVGYVHLKCIQNWMKLKLNMQQNKNIITIFWKNLYCELCKKKFPLNIVHKGEDFSLVPIDNKISGSYVVMESFSKEKDSTGIHLIDLSSNQDFKMGRGHDCDLKISDISVSRVHALLAVSKGKLYLKDNLSKFGTLVLHKGDVTINNNNQETCWIQVGRTIMKFSLKKPFFSFLCFGNFFSLNQAPVIGKLFGKEKEEETKRLTQEGDEIKQNNGLRE